MTWISDARHHEGIYDMSGVPPAAVRRALYTDSIIGCATIRPLDKPVRVPVWCPRRPGKKPCRSGLAIVRTPEVIHVGCVECEGERGMVHGYSGTGADLSKVVLPQVTEDSEILWTVLGRDEHEALYRAMLPLPEAVLDPVLLALVAGAQPVRSESRILVHLEGPQVEMIRLRKVAAGLIELERRRSFQQRLVRVEEALSEAWTGDQFVASAPPEDARSSVVEPAETETPSSTTKRSRKPSRPRRKTAAKKPARHSWKFARSFRAGAFGWRSQPAIQRIKQAVSEIAKVARKDPVLGAEGAVLFLRRLVPAIEQVDSSSGSIGTAVNNAVAKLVPFIAAAPADDATRDRWVDELFEAYQEDGFGYLDDLGDFWGEFCVSKERASRWADKLVPVVRRVFSERNALAIFNGTTACLSSLLAAERYDEVLDLLEIPDRPFWPYEKFGVRALAASGQVDDALARCEQLDPDCGGSDGCRAELGEEILLAAGRRDEAYSRFALAAARGLSYLQVFRSIARKYPEKDPSTILEDLVASHPGDEGVWFATAKHLGLLDRAAELAGHWGVDPKTLNRAARDHVESHPEFAMKVGLASLHAIHAGQGYEIKGKDVVEAYETALAAARRTGREEDVLGPVKRMVEGARDGYVAAVLRRRIVGEG